MNATRNHSKLCKFSYFNTKRYALLVLSLINTTYFSCIIYLDREGIHFGALASSMLLCICIYIYWQPRAWRFNAAFTTIISLPAWSLFSLCCWSFEQFLYFSKLFLYIDWLHSFNQRLNYIYEYNGGCIEDYPKFSMKLLISGVIDIPDFPNSLVMRSYLSSFCMCTCGLMDSITTLYHIARNVWTYRRNISYPIALILLLFILFR